MAVFSMSCDKEDYTGHSNLTPSNPTISIDVPAAGITLLEKDTTYSFTVTLSEAQIVDIAVYVTQIDGNATLGEDYEIGNSGGRIFIPAYSTTATLDIKILVDETPESVETFKLQIGDYRTANAQLTPVIVDFSLQNLAKSDLALTMSWAAQDELFDSYGEQYANDEIADMVFTIEGPLDTVEVDGATFEEYVLTGDLADGVYTLKASFFAVQAGLPATLVDLSLDFYQLGVFSSSSSFEAIATTGSICDYVATLATVTKAGSTYTIAEVGTSEYFVDYTKFVGTWGGMDGYSDLYPQAMTTAFNGTNLDFEGICTEWMVDWWGETVTATFPFQVTLNNDGTFEIPQQDAMTTDYDGSPYTYQIAGSGSWNSCDPSTLHIEYDLYNVEDGYWVVELLAGYGYTEPTFVADFTLGAKKSNKMPVIKNPFVKPTK